jgi:DNA-binding transcriptional LysR family regulator
MRSPKGHNGVRKPLLNWDDLRFFLAIARSGSLTGGARHLRVAQTTVGRRLVSLETSLGAKLLERTPDGYLRTSTGENIRAQAERIEAEILALVRDAGGTDTKVQGQVRIACNEFVAAQILAPKLGALHITHPGLVIEIVPHFEHISLAMREADIALQTGRPTQNGLVMKRVGRIAFGIYASHNYLEKLGVPDFSSGCPNHFVLTFAGDEDDHNQVTWLMSVTSKARHGFQTSSHTSLLAAAAAGGGLACIPRLQGDRQTRLRRLQAPSSPPKLDIWMLVHSDKRRPSRVSTVMSVIQDAFKSMIHSIDP